MRDDNKLRPEDRPAHDWYRFVLSFPAHLVRHYLEHLRVDANQRVLDPFCGTGTTLVECKKRGISSIGIEPNPMACFASQVKVDWSVDPDGLLQHAVHVANLTTETLQAHGIDDTLAAGLFSPPAHVLSKLHTLSPQTSGLLLKNSISPLPLHKTLVLLHALNKQHNDRYAPHERLALAKAIVFHISNLHFGPEVGVGLPKPDAPVVATWLDCVRSMADDLQQLHPRWQTEALVYRADSRHLANLLQPNSVDAVITSPPYPNEKDYTRTTRLESVLLGFIRNRHDLRSLKQDLIRSNTRGVYKTDSDDLAVANHRQIQRIAHDIEARRIQLGKTSGFERLYAKVTKLYFGGMARHLSQLSTILRPGARLAYVVGDQASYLQVMIRTGQLLADIALSLGYEVLGLDLFRTRLATATRQQLREEVLLLRWPGDRL
jgi:SAM-dependent methyltransferase